METTEQWLARIGSKEAFEQRVKERLSGRLNAPIKGTRGLANLVGEMTGAIEKHKISCQCEQCVPDEVKEWMEARNPQKFEKIESKPVEQPKGKKGFKQPVRKWSEQRGRSSN